MNESTTTQVTVMSDKGSEVSVPFDLTQKFTAIVPVRTICFLEHELSALLVQSSDPILARFDPEGKDGRVWVIHKPIPNYRKQVEICYDPAVAAKDLFALTFFRYPPKKGHSCKDEVTVLKHLMQVDEMNGNVIAKLIDKSACWVYDRHFLIALDLSLLEMVGREIGHNPILSIEWAIKLTEMSHPVQVDAWQRLSKLRTKEEVEKRLEKILKKYREWMHLQSKKWIESTC